MGLILVVRHYVICPLLELTIFLRITARPGDYLQHGDDEVDGFKHRLNERLAPVGSQFSGEGVNEDWEIGDTLAQWWRPNFETFMYPFLPGHVTRPKECKKLYFIQLPKKSEFYILDEPIYKQKESHLTRLFSVQRSSPCRRT